MPASGFPLLKYRTHLVLLPAVPNMGVQDTFRNTPVYRLAGATYYTMGAGISSLSLTVVTGLERSRYDGLSGPQRREAIKALFTAYANRVALNDPANEYIELTMPGGAAYQLIPQGNSYNQDSTMPGSTTISMSFAILRDYRNISNPPLPQFGGSSSQPGSVALGVGEINNPTGPQGNRQYP